jgi:hypothetical protein
MVKEMDWTHSEILSTPRPQFQTPTAIDFWRSQEEVEGNLRLREGEVHRLRETGLYYVLIKDMKDRVTFDDSEYRGLSQDPYTGRLHHTIKPAEVLQNIPIRNTGWVIKTVMAGYVKGDPQCTSVVKLKPQYKRPDSIGYQIDPIMHYLNFDYTQQVTHIVSL